MTKSFWVRGYAGELHHLIELILHLPLVVGLHHRLFWRKFVVHFIQGIHRGLLLLRVKPLLVLHGDILGALRAVLLLRESLLHVELVGHHFSSLVLLAHVDEVIEVAHLLSLIESVVLEKLSLLLVAVAHND